MTGLTKGNVNSTSRKFAVAPSGSSTLSSSWIYDNAGRMTSYTSPASEEETYTLDKAGNPITVFTARSHTISMTYDAVNRLTKRVVPQVSYSSLSCSSFYTISCGFSFPRFDGSSVCLDADTAQFSYDAEGNLLTANNKYARVKRSYNRNGLVATDSLRIRTYREPFTTGCYTELEEDAPSPYTEFNAHSYGLKYTWNHAGQRLAMKQPGTLGSDSTRWVWETTRGLLNSVVDWKGNTTGFSYDAAGRLTQIAHPGSWYDDREYDDDGNLTLRSVLRSGVAQTVADTMAYDVMGRLLRGGIGYQSAASNYREVNLTYSKLGSVLSSDAGTTDGTLETFWPDALGNRRRRRQDEMKPGHPDEDGIRLFTYDGAGRVSTIEAPYDPQYFFEQTFDYDASGNAKLTYSQETDYYAEGTLWDASMQYHSADQKLRVVDRFIGLGGASDDSRPGQRGVFEEHRYDALGRRVLSRVRRGTACTANDPECASYVQRTVWDGDQILWEVRAKGADSLDASYFESDATNGTSTDGYAYGRVSYIHGHGIDQPIGVTRSHMTEFSDVVLIPHANWRGLYEAGSTSGGTLQASCGGSTCPDVDWPGTFVAVDGGRPDPQAGTGWMGSLIAQGRDGSGLDYRRNRYYNPETGQFTQEDPIGLAGGANLYGFAGGDPVNFSDPLGLCPPYDRNTADCSAEVQRLLAADRAMEDVSFGTFLAVSGVVGAVRGGMAAMGRALFGRVSGGVAEAVVEPSAGMLRQFSRQLAADRRGSVERSIQSLERRLGQHLTKLKDINARGGDPGSVEREITNFRRQIDAPKRVLEKQ